MILGEAQGGHLGLLLSVLFVVDENESRLPRSTYRIHPLSLLTLNEQRPRVHECALSSLFKFVQQCFLAFFLDIPVLIIIIMEFGIGPQFVWYMGPICGTCYQSHREVHRRVGFTSLLIITPPICGHCGQPDSELNRQMECVIPE